MSISIEEYQKLRNDIEKIKDSALWNDIYFSMLKVKNDIDMISLKIDNLDAQLYSSEIALLKILKNNLDYTLTEFMEH